MQSQREFDLASQELQLLRKAFGCHFKDPLGVSNHFLDCLDNWSSKWKPTVYYAPYTSLVQGSGTGKSRLFKEISRNVYIFYCCFRSLGSTGYPQRSSIASVLLDTPSDRYGTILQFVAYLNSSLLQLAEELSQEFPCTKSEWYKQQIKESEVEGFRGSFWAPIKQKMDHFVKSFDMPQKEENFCAQLQNALKSTVFTVRSMLSNQTRALEVIFAFDEARALLEPHDTLNGNNLFYYLIMA